ncbi:pyrimidine 5'-nucleotidase [Thalassobacter stenotrophicus]|uniref:Phosphoglycolate phosphatase n=2 Tax=Thalassobacter stenotrophicus TaxID=266809 RepID=A0A0P1FHR8_9RHOB|nr:pyrimidine 5'-nucleotidase [Thalassobacter stenotrophicus]PVZ47656.1 pyrimidine 5'-nucleotidase [Thalassobacter stenotrophicus]CUH60456.1 phosphoglycolate phosphatase [Thalassobacter stenotrophicus]SHI75794.1 putative hydrolase of the HAD superfamily [Thalassobacter stenotrophicus DSM 16310]
MTISTTLPLPFEHVTTWVFDLDNTLYPSHVRLFDQIEVRMRDYVARTLRVDLAEADRLRAHYWRTHGTTLAGLMREHAIDPDPFLDHVHDIDFSVLPRDATLADRIARLPGRRIVYTNGTAPYAARVLEARGLSHLFDALYGVEHAGYQPKPDAAAFDTVFTKDNLVPRRAAMFEDEPRNLQVPHELGMATVLVAETRPRGEHIHHHTHDLSDFLAQIVD